MAINDGIDEKVTYPLKNLDIDVLAGLVIGFDPLEKISQKGMNSHRYGNTVVYAAIKFAIEETTKHIVYILFILKGSNIYQKMLVLFVNKPRVVKLIRPVVEAGFALVRTRGNNQFSKLYYKGF
ncbi:10091_t:CDS:2 [Entrophospora sp. SA101]|nr:10091_t:CDS:2 [Entrophospora sp. SA101]